jgi:hypothetical protein
VSRLSFTVRPLNERLSINKTQDINTQDIKEPPCPLDEHRFKACLTFVEGELTYYINRRYRAGLLWLFWFNYAQSPYYEDPSLENAFYEKLTNRADWVPYSETIIIKPEDTIKREQDYPKGYRQLAERLDFYVTKLEFSEAYRAVQKLGRRQGTEQIREVTILSSLRVRLLSDSEFGERSEETELGIHWYPSDPIRGASMEHD